MSSNHPSYYIHILYREDFYEVLVRDRTITNITKYLGDSQFPRTIDDFDDLAEEVQEQIEQEIQKHTNGG